MPAGRATGSVRVPGLKLLSSLLPFAYTSTVRPGTPCRTETSDVPAACDGAATARPRAAATAPAAARVRRERMGAPGVGWIGAVTPASAPRPGPDALRAARDSAHSQRNQRTAARAGRQRPREENRERADVEPAVLEGRPGGVAERARGQHRGDPAERAADRDDDAAESDQQHPEQVRGGEHGLAAQGPGEQQAERDERRRAGERDDRPQQQPHRIAAARRAPGDDAEDGDLDGLDDEDGEHAPGEQSGAAERRGAEQPQDAVAAVEGRGDRLPREGGGEHGEREDAGGDDVDPAAGPEVRDGGEGQPGEQQRGQDDRQEQLFPVAQEHARVEEGLGSDPGRRRRRLGGAGARSAAVSVIAAPGR